MFQIKTKNTFALKVAPWWKRILAYTIDNLFLFMILVIFIKAMYGQEFSIYLEKITEYGGIKLGIQDKIFNQEIVDHLSTLSTDQQDLFYWFSIIQQKYAKTIFLLSQLLSIIYFTLFWWSTGQTIGAKILKIKVISPLYEQIPFMSVMIRVTILKLVEIAWGLPILVVVNPILKQRIHDSLSNTVVIEELSKENEDLLSNQLLEEDLTDLPSDSESFDDNDNENKL